LIGLESQQKTLVSAAVVPPSYNSKTKRKTNIIESNKATKNQVGVTMLVMLDLRLTGMLQLPAPGVFPLYM